MADKRQLGDYGDNGYYWISYEDTSLDSFASYEFYPAEDTDNNYTYSTNGMESYLSSSEEIYQANVFTAEGDELLKAVSFYTYQTNGNESVEYRFDIYKNVEFGGDTPLSGSRQPAFQAALTSTAIILWSLTRKLICRRAILFR